MSIGPILGLVLIGVIALVSVASKPPATKKDKLKAANRERW